MPETRREKLQRALDLAKQLRARRSGSILQPDTTLPDLGTMRFDPDVPQPAVSTRVAPPPRRPEGIQPPSTPLALGIAGAGAGESFVNTLKRLVNAAVTGGDVMGVGVQPPFKEETGAQEFAAGMRPMQTLGQNIGADILGAAPYAIPHYFLTELATRPEAIPDLLKSISESHKDVRAAIDPFVQKSPLKTFFGKKPKEEVSAARERIRQRPLGTAFDVALPITLGAGGARGAKAIEAKAVKKLGPVGRIITGGEPTPMIKLPGQFKKKGVKIDSQAKRQVVGEERIGQEPGRAVQQPPTGRKAALPSRALQEKKVVPSRLTPKAKRKLERAGVVKPAPEQPSLSKPQIDQAKTRIRKHYDLKRPVTDAEVLAEVTSLRKRKGDFDDLQGKLAASLETGQHPIDLQTQFRPPKPFPTELGAVGAPETFKAFGKTVVKVAKVVKAGPPFLQQARKRIKSTPGQDAVKMIEQADNVQHSKYEGPWSEKMREAGIRGIKKESEAVRIGKELQKPTTSDPVAGKLRNLLDEMQQTAERKGVKIAYRKGYLPRRLKTEVREKLFDESVKIIDELKATSQSDRAVKAALQHRSDFLKEAVEHLMKEKGQSYKSAINSINFLSRQEIFRKTAAEHRRTQFLPSHFYETDVRKIIPEYVREISQRIAQVEVFGRNADKWSKKMQEVMDIDFKESQMLQDLVDMWSGDIIAERGFRGTARKVQNLYYGFEMSTKIGAGTAAIPNITQPMISSMPAAGVWRSVKGGYQTLLKTGRKRARVSGALNHAALLTFGGVEPTGVMAKITKFAPMMKPFKAINRFNQYLSATTYEVLVKDLHRMANKPGIRQKWARAKLEKFDVDHTKPLTQEKISEGMYRFATDEQLQRNVLDDPYMFNLPKVKPFVLFKRFGYRQFVKTKNNLKFELSHGNVFPLVRLLMGGIAGGEGVIFAKNKLKSWLTGEPVYREEDWADWQRYVNDIAAVGSFGVVSDIMDISKVSDLWSGLKFTVTPVPVADIEQIYKTGEKIFKDLDKREIGDVIRRQSPELLNLSGSLPRWTKQRLRTEQQKWQRARFFRGRKRTEILDLMLRGEGDKAGRLISLWNKNHPTNPLGSDDINWTELKNRAKARVRLGYRK